MDRIGRDELFIRAAQLWSQRSTCMRGHVGCVLVKDKRIVSTGYNGSPPGMDHCLDVGCEVMEGELSVLGCQRTIHAEANAVAFAARSGLSLAGAAAFCTHSPCRNCAEILASAGINAIIYDKFYRATPWDYLDQLGFIFYQWEGKLPDEPTP